ncbi:MAG: S-layer protein [Planctomycetaceae bacterium]|nr:S-layer protein [Planctomycetaceae bacterium]
MHLPRRIVVFGVFSALLGGGVFPVRGANEKVARLDVVPKACKLVGRSAKQRLLVTGVAPQSGLTDRTREASFQTTTPKIVRVDAQGMVEPLADGMGKVIVQVDEFRAEVSVEVIQAGELLPVDFRYDVQPLFTRNGCNTGACHAKARGPSGFQISLYAFDADFDHIAITKESRGRRLFPADPAASLILRKPAAEIPHGGGKRFESGGEHYNTLLRWIEAGAPPASSEVAELQRIVVEPGDRILQNGEQQQLLVTAWFADGSRRDITGLCNFQSSESTIAEVDEQGLITAGEITGDAAIMARFLEEFAICNIAVPLKGNVPAAYYAKLPRHNDIDEHVWNKLERLGLTPSEPAGDERFLRRATIDVIGRVPTPEEARDFLKADPKTRRVALIERLLEEPEFPEHWANKWADLLRPNPYRVGIKATMNFDHWIRDAFRKGKPMDEFTRELLSARGGTFRNGAVTLFRDRRSPDELTTIVGQLFLGIRLECAKCHHHPFEAWSQKDFFSLAAYFAKIGRKGRGVSPPISGSEEFVFTASKGSVSHPVTGAVLEPHPLFGDAPAIGEGEDPRVALAEWITSKDNPYFAQVMVNRVWADLMGRGIVEPVDDLRATNPPTNGPLLDALAADFVADGFNLKKLIRRITTSHVYGLSAIPNKRNVVDTRNYSRHYRRRLRAEVLLDAVSAITEVEESFAAMPAGASAKELWTHRISSEFLDAFGRPDPNQDPPCERTGESTIVQTLHLMNSRNLFKKVSADAGRAARLAKSDLTPANIVEELYLLVYSRLPTENELRVTTAVFQEDGKNRRSATEDLLWALLNTPEFVFKN